ncbi:LTA synthase family protein [Aminipila sp.]|uniref:LTA synthase family protein n=2 Tax=Aminipila sp. TaxID=2060095 RepID=UPI00289D6D2F|nr:sulfatase-like hydrolase/transferase [Aminipila sp.]
MENFKKFFMKYLHNAITISLVLAFALNLIIETLARHSLANGFRFFLDSPLVFMYNVFLIFLTLSMALLIKRRVFVYVVFSALWLTLGITNGVILANRMTPFTTKDLAVLDDGLSIVTNYLTTTEIVLACGGVVVGVILIILLFKFAPKKKDKINYKKNVALFLAITVGLIGATDLAIKTKVVDTFFGNLAYAYRDYGVPYCFINTWLNTGIRQPADYSQDSILSIFDKGELGDENYAKVEMEDDGKDHPNVIFLQMESFIDPTLVKNVTYSEDPIPNFRALENKYSSGYLTVPVVGAGTANTEFEVLTGMSVKYFGPGEYPYKSILTEETCESVPYGLKSIGYSTHAIHNHRAVFYGRNKVFANLGFDTFTSIEYMNHVVKTPKNWAKDFVLTDQIMDALQSTDREDFIYTCSVQGHGKYPTEKVIEEPEIVVTDAPTEELKWQYEYYVNQIHDMDQFIGQLTERLQKYDEKVVLVIYGDHLPVLEMTEDDMVNGSIFQTKYVVWSNFPMKKIDKDLYSYQVAADVLDRLGFHMGVINKFHQNHKDSQTYRSDLKKLEYDMLYGKKYIFNEQNPYKKINLQMGIKPIKIKEIVRIGDKLYIKGENFTEYSKISLDGEILKTIFLGSSILGLQEEVDLDAVNRMKVSQVEKNKEILSTTE